MLSSPVWYPELEKCIPFLFFCFVDNKDRSSQLKWSDADLFSATGFSHVQPPLTAMCHDQQYAKQLSPSFIPAALVDHQQLCSFTKPFSYLVIICARLAFTVIINTGGGTLYVNRSYQFPEFLYQTQRHQASLLTFVFWSFCFCTPFIGYYMKQSQSWLNCKLPDEACSPLFQIKWIKMWSWFQDLNLHLVEALSVSGSKTQVDSSKENPFTTLR